MFETYDKSMGDHKNQGLVLSMAGTALLRPADGVMSEIIITLFNVAESFEESMHFVVECIYKALDSGIGDWLLYRCNKGGD